jgi:hypothetical protein
MAGPRARVSWHPGKAIAKVRRGAQRGTEKAGARVLEKAQQIVPHETGTLEGSGDIEPLGEGRIGVMVFFGGAAAPYAVIQHEDLTLHHANGRQAKYLERPAMEGRADTRRDVAEGIRRELGS